LSIKATKVRTIAFVAHDMMPSRAFKLISKALEIKGGYEIKARYGRDPESAKQTIESVVNGAEIVMLGMSSSKELAADELFAADLAIQNGARIIYFSDTYSLFNRDWVGDRFKGATITVIDEDEAEEARKLLPESTIVATGNPLWDEYFIPKGDRNAVRSALGIQGEMILYTGGKSKMVNIHQVNCVIDALQNANVVTEEREIVFSVRADELNPDDMDLYLEIKKYSPVPFHIVLTKQHRDQWVSANPGKSKDIAPAPFSASELISAADLVIQLASGVGIEAAHLRIPVIDYFSITGKRRHEESMGKNFRWQPAERGATTAVYNTIELSDYMYLLIYHTGARQRWRDAQERAFPKGENNTPALDKVLKLLD
jgi:hypothetical protein